MDLGQQDSKELTLTIKKPEKVKITKVSINHESFKLVKKSDDNAGISKYEVKYLGRNKVGSISAKVIIEAEGADKPSTEVFVRAVVLGDLKYPRTLFFSKEEGAFKPEEIIITSRSDKTFKVTGIKDPSGKLKTEITEAKGTRAVVKAEVADQTVPYPKTERFKMTVLTNDKHQPEIVISYVISDEAIKRGRGRDARKLRAIPPIPGTDRRNPIGIQ